MPAHRSRATNRAVGPLALLAVIALSVFVLLSGRPPAPVPATAPDRAFSAERAMMHVETLAVRPRAVGTEQHAAVRHWLASELESLGLSPTEQATLGVGRWSGELRAAWVRNVAARIPGTRSTGAVALVAHYDSHPLSPGAGDDASGVAAILETARALIAGPALTNDVILLFTDAEELGLLGARAFVTRHPWMDDVTLIFNVEARGSAGPSLMFETSPNNEALVRAYARHSPAPVATSLAGEIYRRMPNDTDFSPFRDAGVAGLNFAFIEGSHRYHQPFDTPDALSAASLQHHGEQLLALTRHFGSVGLATIDGERDTVYFNLPLVGLLVYDPRWVMPLAVLGLVLWVGLLVWAFARHRARVRDLLAGVGVTVIGLGVANRVAEWLVPRLLARQAERFTLDGSSIFGETWLLLVVTGITVFLLLALWLLARRWCAAPGMALGALALPLALVVVTAWWLPGASMVPLWPSVSTLAAVAYLLARSDAEDGRVEVVVVLTVLLAPVFCFFVPLLHGVFYAMTIEMASIIAVIVGLTVVHAFPLLDCVRLPNRWWSLAGTGAATVVCLTVAVWPREATPERPDPTSLFYAMDRDAGTALWATGRAESDAWLAQVIPTDAQWSALERFLPNERRRFRTAPAPLVDVPPPQARIVSATPTERGRRLMLAVRSAAAAPSLRVRAPGASDVRLAAVNGIALPEAGEGGLDLALFGAGAEDVSLELEVAGDADTLELDVLEQLYQLPATGELDRARPATLFPTRREWSDRTVLRQRFVLPIE